MSPRSIVANFRMTKEDASRFLKLCKRFPTSRSAVMLRAFTLGVDALEKDPSLFAVEQPVEAEEKTS